ncbi:MAG: cytochrome c biogenesis protein ResB, partial [Campylobacteraceae bacterium]|nr:cytochrome c biogenesis protein ResB [Campylobacteraceae bacterium]
MKKITSIFFSFWLMGILLIILGVGAGVATFIENDFGAQTAQLVVYKTTWYEAAMVLIIINMLCVMYKFKMWQKPSKFLLHFSFVFIVLGAGTTRYMGFEGIMHIREGETVNTMISADPYLQVTVVDEGKSYYQEYPLAFGGIGDNSFEYNIAFNSKVLNIKYKKYSYQKQGTSVMGIISMDATIDGESKEYTLRGSKGSRGLVKTQSIGDTKVSIEYGSKPMKIPFSIKLNDFQLDRYPGSMSPSSYASEVTVIDSDKTFDYRIFMNTTLHNGNYLFFQSSYDQDEKGTILTVNNDPGKWPTYLGYFMLTLGLVLNLFDKKGRFFKLTSYLKRQNLASFILAIAMLGSINTYAAEDETNATVVEKEEIIQDSETVSYLKRYKDDSISIAANFGKLVTQSGSGRMKPLNSLNIEIVRKISTKATLFGMNPDQIVLGMLTRPELWRNIKMIKVKTPKLKKLIGIDESRNFIAFSEIFKDGIYMLSDEVDKANRIQPAKRGTFEKDLIGVDERLNVAYMTYNGNLLKIIPKRFGTKEENNKWTTPLDAIKDFKGKDQEAVESMIRGFVNSVVDENWDNAGKYLAFLTTYQEKVGADVIPSKLQIEIEIMFIQIDIFPKLTV